MSTMEELEERVRRLDTPFYRELCDLMIKGYPTGMVGGCPFCKAKEAVIEKGKEELRKQEALNKEESK